MIKIQLCPPFINLKGKRSGTLVVQASYIVNIISRLNAGLSLPLRGSLLLLARAYTCRPRLRFAALVRAREFAFSRSLMSCNSACACAGIRHTRTRARSSAYARVHVRARARTRGTYSWETSKNLLSIEFVH